MYNEPDTEPTEAAFASAEQRLALVLEGRRMGTWQWDVASNRVVWSPGLERVHGIPEGSFGGTFEAYQQDIHVDDRSRVLSTIARTLEHGDDHYLEYRIIRPDGATRWLEAFGRVLTDANGRRIGMMGVCADITERKLTELAVRESESWFATTLASVGDGVVATDTQGRVRYLNPVGEQLTGRPLAEARGLPMTDVLRLLRHETRALIESPITQVLREGATVGFGGDTVLMDGQGREISIDAKGAPIRDARGEVIGVVIVFRDVTQERLEEARQAFLQEAMRLLASSLDPEQAVATVTTLAVPRVADWCGVDLVDRDGILRRLAVAHLDPRKVELAHELHRRYPPDPKQPHGVHEVVRSGVSQLVSEISDELLAQLAPDPEHLAIARELGLKSYMIVPIRGSGGILGAVSFVTAEANRRFTTDDLRLAEQLCDCAAIAIANGRLYRGVQEARAEAEAATFRAAKLQQVALALAATETESEVASVAIDISRHLGATAAVLYVAEGDSLRMAAQLGLEGTLQERFSRVALDSPLPLAKAVRTQTAQWLESRDALRDEYPQLQAEAVPETMLQSAFALPLVVHGSALGGLGLGFDTARRFGALEREMLVSMAGQIAQAIDRARLRSAERLARVRLEENEQRYRYIFESAAVGIAEKDYSEAKRRLDALVASGVTDLRAYLHAHPGLVDEAMDLVRIRDVNAAMVRLFNAKDKQQLFSLREIVGPESRSLFIEELVALSDGTKLVAGETRLRRLDGQPFYALTTIAFPPAGYDRVLVSRTDITEHKQVLEQLSATVRFHEMFTGILAHDLRSPLSAILTGAQVVKERVQDEGVRRSAARIVSSGERMARMIEQLLDFTRARVGGGIRVERRPTDLVQLCRQMVGELRDAHPNTVITLETLGDGQGTFDPDRLAQVFSNLVGNACQHSSERAPVRVRLDGLQATTLVLSVVNEGEIPPDVLPVLFDPFRSGRERHGRAQGLGLGLFITQQIVQGHGGTIEAASSNGLTTMTVSLPR